MSLKSFDILHIRELPSSIIRDDDVAKEDIAKSRLSYLVVFQHQEGNEAVALHVSLRLQSEGKTVLLQEGATFIVKVIGWDEMAKDEPSLRGNERIIALVDYGLAFVSGMVFRHVSGTALNSLDPPIIDAMRIMDHVVIDLRPKQPEAESNA